MTSAEAEAWALADLLLSKQVPDTLAVMAGYELVGLAKVQLNMHETSAEQE